MFHKGDYTKFRKGTVRAAHGVAKLTCLDTWKLTLKLISKLLQADTISNDFIKFKVYYFRK
jgi:hypothetical protein